MAGGKETGMSEWQPIETAPEGLELLVLRRDGGMHVAKISGLERKFGILSADFGNASCSFFFPAGVYSTFLNKPLVCLPLEIRRRKSAKNPIGLANQIRAEEALARLPCPTIKRMEVR